MNNVPAKGSKRRLVFALFLGVWLLKLILGVIDVTGRHVPSYPDAVRGSPDIGQMGLYVVIPSVFVVLNLLLFVFANRLQKWLAIIIAILQILLLLILLFFSTGGI
jgi:hypothetical protein